MEDDTKRGTLIPSDDLFDLQRFLAAQEPVFETALAELRAGRKRSHWMWFIFPQMRELGRSPTAAHYGIASLGEAVAYVAHPVLGARLREATHAVLSHRGASAHAIFGSPDDMKFLSSMTLFARVDASDPYRHALDAFSSGEEDQATISLLSSILAD